MKHIQGMHYSNLDESFNPPVESSTKNIESFTSTQPYIQWQMRTPLQTQSQLQARDSPLVKFSQYNSAEKFNKNQQHENQQKQHQNQQNQQNQQKQQHKKTKPIKPIPKPGNTKPQGKPSPPVELPSDVSSNNWQSWWKKNKYYYGDRNYYVRHRYPMWWVNYYYPEWDDIYYDYDYDYDYNTTPIIQQSQQSQQEMHPFIQISNQIDPTFYLLSGSSCIAILLIIIIILQFKK